MTPKEKAEELVLKYLKMKRHKMFNGWWHKIISKQCALIAVDELIDFAKLTDATNGWDHLNYWIQVKQEIEKL
jgi:hypothetical protein